MNCSDFDSGKNKQESANISYLEKSLSYAQDGRYFELTKRIPGEPLSTAWVTMSSSDKERVVKQTNEYVLQLRNLQSTQIWSINRQPIYSVFLLPNYYSILNEPLSSNNEL
jgi:hypothetical protein